MPQGVRKCKVCGKEYRCCPVAAKAGVFNWKQVACCKEHGEIYLQSVLEARAAKKSPSVVATAEAATEVTSESDKEENINSSAASESEEVEIIQLDEIELVSDDDDDEEESGFDPLEDDEED